MFDADPMPLFRPPAEADSFIVRVVEGCPHNTCAFCGMYKGRPYRARPLSELRAELARRRDDPDATRAFLADGDALAPGPAALAAAIAAVRAARPSLRRIGIYANGRSLVAAGAAELRALRALGLHTVYVGLESGCEDVLRRMRKPESAATIVEGVRLAQDAGVRASVMVLIGLGGRADSARHARETAAALNAMQPRLLAALRVVPIPGTPLARDVEHGVWTPLSEHEAVAEMRALIAALDLRQTVFRANHASNSVPLEGRLPRDRDSLLALLDVLLRAGRLDRHSPGPQPLWL